MSQDIRTAPYYNVVHLSGFDIHQATQLYRSANTQFKWLDVSPSTNPTLGYLEGYVLANRTGAPVPLNAQSLANLICAPPPVPPPSIVSSNIYNSAYEIAPSMVAAGAHSAIGFQDTFDDQLAEQFFATFYRSWVAADWNPIAAFNFAWEQIRARRVPLQGSGLVLWTKHALDGVRLITEQTLRAHTREKIEITAANAREYLEVKVEPLKELNYSILHNDGALFKEFSIKKKSLNVGEVSDLHVYVELNVGTDNYPFTGTLALGYSDSGRDLKDLVRISLASALNRALRENVRTSLVVYVMWHDRHAVSQDPPGHTVVGRRVAGRRREPQVAAVVRAAARSGGAADHRPCAEVPHGAARRSDRGLRRLSKRRQAPGLAGGGMHRHRPAGARDLGRADLRHAARLHQSAPDVH